MTASSTPKVDTAKHPRRIPGTANACTRPQKGTCAALVSMLLANHDVVMEEQLMAAKTAARAASRTRRRRAPEMRVISRRSLPIIDPRCRL
jgi:hypothetical protein